MPDDRNDIAGVVAPPPLIYAVPLLVGLLLHWLRPVPLSSRGVMRSLGVLCIGAGAALIVSGVRSMHHVGTEPDPRTPSTALAIEGPYRFTRNPLYLGMTVLYSGITLLANALWAALFLPVVLAVMGRGVIAREERYLDRRFGDEYRAYRLRVRRWL